MKSLTLRQLRYFEALAQHGHFGRAADVCSISQPALSVQIKELEETLAAQLFERSPRQVQLTAFGEEFAPRAREILRGVDELADLARAARTGLVGRLRIGVIPTIAPYLLPDVIGGIAALYPQLDIQIRETVTPGLLQELADGRLDTAIVALPIGKPGLTEVPLFCEDLALVQPKSDPPAPVPTRKSLRKMRLLMLEEGHCFRDQVLSYCGLGSGAAREGLDGSSLSTLVQMVGAGIGVTLIPDMAIAIETRSAPVTITRFEAPAPTRTVGMIWRKTSPLAPQLRDISELVQRCGKTLGSRGL